MELLLFAWARVRMLAYNDLWMIPFWLNVFVLLFTKRCIHINFHVHVRLCWIVSSYDWLHSSHARACMRACVCVWLYLAGVGLLKGKKYQSRNECLSRVYPATKLPFIPSHKTFDPNTYRRFLLVFWIFGLIIWRIGAIVNYFTYLLILDTCSFMYAYIVCLIWTVTTQHFCMLVLNSFKVFSFNLLYLAIQIPS